MNPFSDNAELTLLTTLCAVSVSDCNSKILSGSIPCADRSLLKSSSNKACRLASLIAALPSASLQAFSTVLETSFKAVKTAKFTGLLSLPTSKES